MGGIGFSKSGSKSSGSSASGIQKSDRDKAFNASFNLLNQALPQAFTIRQNAPVRQLSPLGLQTQTQRLFDTAINQAGRQNFSNASASAAQRGALSPQSLERVLGDTARRTTAQLAPTFAPIAEANQAFNASSSFNALLEQLNQLQRFATLFGQLTQGSEGQQSGSSSSFGFNAFAGKGGGNQGTGN